MRRRALLTLASRRVCAAALLGALVTACHGDNTGPNGSSTHQRLYVGDNGTIYGNVLGFSIDANGDAAPVSVLGGPSTGVQFIRGMAFDSAGRLYVASTLYSPSTPSIVVFAPKASGNAAPIRVISGAATLLDSLENITVDSDGTVYAAVIGAIRVFAPGADGNVAPAASLIGPSKAGALALASDRRLYVANLDGFSILIYAAHAAAGSSPVDSIAGPATRYPYGISLAIDPTGGVHAPSPELGEYWEGFVTYAGDATGDVAPVAVASGLHVGALQPLGLASDASANLFYLDAYFASVSKLPANANGDVAPIAVISGPHTGLLLPARIAVH